MDIAEHSCFQVTITTVRPADAACAQALEPFEESISLDLYGLPAGSYTVNVNGTIGTSELVADNVMLTEPPSHVGPSPAILEVDGQEQLCRSGLAWGAVESARLPTDGVTYQEWYPFCESSPLS